MVEELLLSSLIRIDVRSIQQCAAVMHNALLISMHETLKTNIGSQLIESIKRVPRQIQSTSSSFSCCTVEDLTASKVTSCSASPDLWGRSLAEGQRRANLIQKKRKEKNKRRKSRGIPVNDSKTTELSLGCDAFEPPRSRHKQQRFLLLFQTRTKLAKEHRSPPKSQSRA